MSFGEPACRVTVPLLSVMTRLCAVRANRLMPARSVLMPSTIGGGGNGYVRRQAVAIIFLKYACQQRRANQFHDNVNIAFWWRFHNGCESQFMFVLTAR